MRVAGLDGEWQLLRQAGNMESARTDPVIQVSLELAEFKLQAADLRCGATRSVKNALVEYRAPDVGTGIQT